MALVWGILLAGIALAIGWVLVRRRRSAAARKPAVYECTVCGERDCDCRKSGS